MSASTAPFTRIRKPNQPVIQAPAPPFSRVAEPDESVVYPPPSEEISAVKPESPPHEAIRTFNKNWLVYLWMLASLVGGVTAGRLLYLLWEHVASHDQQLTSQQTAIRALTETRTAVSDQANHLKALDTSTATLQTLLDAQAKRLTDLERGQAGILDQINGMNTRWQKQVNELHRAPIVTTPVARGESSTTASNPAATPVQPAFDKHNETFSPDLKPTANSYAQMSANGLVVWMTPRPGSPKPVPTSVIGYVRGLGMLVHNWEDNKHYFITDTGSWLADQR